MGTAESLASELQGRIWEATVCLHGNYVVQKCIKTLNPDSEWISGEILSWGVEGVRELAMHRFGCRVYCRLLEHCNEKQKAALVECLLGDVVVLSKAEFGNYCVNHILQYGSAEHRDAVMALVQPEAVSLATDYYAGAVI